MRHGRSVRALVSFFLFLTLTSVACHRASRFGPVPKAPTKEDETKPEPIRPSDLWLAPKQVLDAPIVFVQPGGKDWQQLPAFWNEFPPKIAGIRTSHLGQSPLGAAVGMALAWQAEVVKIKVPLGLPDPTPQVPSANPPTVGKWQLGKQLFFDKILQTPAEKLACVTCHAPPRFCNDFPVAPQSTINTPSLINSIFNRRQFWDGRVGMIEETIFREVSQESSLRKEAPDLPPHYRHNWTGVVELLRTNDAMKERYQEQFQRVFGIRQPTHDAIAKALATYVRTLLSGDSVYDRAEAERVRGQSPTLSIEHFEAVLDESARHSVDAAKTPRAELAKELARGFELFQGKARCASCHHGPLFTDHDFHNVGLGELIDYFPGMETGRFANVPVGLKDKRLIGAFRTPTLRALPRTGPYMHDGGGRSLDDVVQYFNKIESIRVGPSMAGQLLDESGRPRHLELTADESRALVRFLRSLNGQPLDKKLIE